MMLTMPYAPLLLFEDTRACEWLLFPLDLKLVASTVPSSPLLRAHGDDERSSHVTGIRLEN